MLDSDAPKFRVLFCERRQCCIELVGELLAITSGDSTSHILYREPILLLPTPVISRPTAEVAPHRSEKARRGDVTAARRESTTHL
jgi:hypothetical protein